MFVFGQTTVISNFALAGGGIYGVAFYDLKPDYLSGINPAQAANVAFAVPPDAHYLRASIVAINIGALMIVAGAALPSSYINYSYSIAQSANSISQSRT